MGRGKRQPNAAISLIERIFSLSPVVGERVGVRGRLFFIVRSIRFASPAEQLDVFADHRHQFAPSLGEDLEDVVFGALG